MTPFKFQDVQIKHTTIYFCHFSKFSPKDYLNYLSIAEQHKLRLFRSQSRRMEFVASRILRHSVFGFKHIQYDVNGAPFVAGSGFISISHTKGLVALALNHNFKIGLDLEIPRDNILEISPKFLSLHEREQFDISNKKEVTKIWSAKEALYKLAGRKKIHFKTELLLETGKDQDWLGTIINSDHTLSVKLDIFEYKDVIISINNEPVIKRKTNS